MSTQDARMEDAMTCPNEANHTPTPPGYRWLTRYERPPGTHVQRQCPACGKWAIWVPTGKATR